MRKSELEEIREDIRSSIREVLRVEIGKAEFYSEKELKSIIDEEPFNYVNRQWLLKRLKSTGLFRFPPFPILENGEIRLCYITEHFYSDKIERDLEYKDAVRNPLLAEACQDAFYQGRFGSYYPDFFLGHVFRSGQIGEPLIRKEVIKSKKRIEDEMLSTENLGYSARFSLEKLLSTEDERKEFSIFLSVACPHIQDLLQQGHFPLDDLKEGRYPLTFAACCSWKITLAEILGPNISMLNFPFYNSKVRFDSYQQIPSLLENELQLRKSLLNAVHRLYWDSFELRYEHA